MKFFPKAFACMLLALVSAVPAAFAEQNRTFNRGGSLTLNAYPRIEGDWYDSRGYVATIDGNGPNYTFDVTNSPTNGYFINYNTVSVGWGITGTVSGDANTIYWSNGVVWTRALPNLSGSWHDSRGYIATINQVNNALTLAVNGAVASGSLTDSSHITCGWGITGIYSRRNGHRVINWSNGVVWDR